MIDWNRASCPGRIGTDAGATGTRGPDAAEAGGGCTGAARP